eukprot:gene20436-27224_t
MAMRGQLVSLQDEGDIEDLQKAEIDRLKQLVETLQARSARPTTAVGLKINVTGDSPRTAESKSMRADQGYNMLFETLVLEMGFDPDISRQAILSLPCGTMDEIVDYVQGMVFL